MDGLMHSELGYFARSLISVLLRRRSSYQWWIQVYFARGGGGGAATAHFELIKRIQYTGNSI